jgi:hypothetical protein
MAGGSERTVTVDNDRFQRNYLGVGGGWGPMTLHKTRKKNIELKQCEVSSGQCKLFSLQRPKQHSMLCHGVLRDYRCYRNVNTF